MCLAALSHYKLIRTLSVRHSGLSTCLCSAVHTCPYQSLRPQYLSMFCCPYLSIPITQASVPVNVLRSIPVHTSHSGLSTCLCSAVHTCPYQSLRPQYLSMFCGPYLSVPVTQASVPVNVLRSIPVRTSHSGLSTCQCSAVHTCPYQSLRPQYLSMFCGPYLSVPVTQASVPVYVLLSIPVRTSHSGLSTCQCSAVHTCPYQSLRPHYLSMFCCPYLSIPVTQASVPVNVLLSVPVHTNHSGLSTCQCSAVHTCPYQSLRPQYLSMFCCPYLSIPITQASVPAYVLLSIPVRTSHSGLTTCLCSAVHTCPYQSLRTQFIVMFLNKVKSGRPVHTCLYLSMFYLV